MNFNDNRPIYLQINDWVCDQILRGEWQPEARIPSVRELGAFLEVNPNTVMRTYERLQACEVIFNRRGIGYFVAPGAPEIIRTEARNKFFDEELPQFFTRMDSLGISFEELEHHFRRDCSK